jgi:predicted secreted protein
MKKNLSTLAILFIAVFSILTSCKKEKNEEIIDPDANIIKLSLTDTGRVVVLQKGQVFSVTLFNPADGGYNFTNWAYDTTVLHLDTHLHTPPAQHSAPGDSGTDTWRFTTLKSGTTNLQMSIARGLLGAPNDVIDLFKTTIKVQ